MNDPCETGCCYRFPQRVLLRLTGADRQKWLHNFCTADVRSLQPGRGCEAFVLNVKGKTIAHAIILVSDFDVTLLVAGEPEIDLQQHLDRYIIREDVHIQNLDASHELWFARGTRLDEMQGSALTGGPRYGHALIRDGVIAVSTRISERPDWLLLVPRSDAVNRWYGGLQEVDTWTFDRLRFASRFPANGVEVTLAHLPQEFGRDEAAISFTKGCYLGQETVARIDALGHVNFFLVRLDFQSPDVTAGLELFRDDKQVGRVTSCVDLQGLGFVRRSCARAGEVLQSATGPVTVR
jgi:folate-binding protein YgfZ